MPSIVDILQNEDFGQVVKTLCVDTIEGRNAREYYDEYHGERTRRPTSVGFRENKRVAVYSDTLKDKDGNPVRMEDKIIHVAKYVSNFPKKEVRTSTAFLFGGKMTITATDQNDGFEEFKRVWKRKLRMQSTLKAFAKKVLSESKAAILFFPYITTKLNGEQVTELKARILSLPQNKDTVYEFYPHFDETDNMDAFTVHIQISVENAICDQYTIYTDSQTIIATQQNGQWNIEKKANLFGKIPVVYADVIRPEWDDVASAMDAREMRLSRLADSNDYFGDPITKIFGDSDLPSKDTAGKSVTFPVKIDPESGQTYHGDMEYMTWNGSQASVDRELDEMKDEQFSGSSTPDLSFDNLKGIGNMSGVARKFMLMDAMIKASDNMEVFGPVIQRCVSVVLAGICNISNIKYRSQLIDNLIDVEFGSILPEDLAETLGVLNIANGGKPINSQRTITSRSPFTEDVDVEMRLMDEEEKTASQRNSMIGMTFGNE